MDIRKLLLLDGFGALLSSFLLGIVLVEYRDIFGMPKEALYVLAFLPCVFALYDFVCYFLVKNNTAFYLKGIAIANLLYCILSIGYMFHHYEQLTLLGYIYFIGELIIVAALAIYEWKVASREN